MGPKKDKKPKTKEMDTQTDEEKQEVEVQPLLKQKKNLSKPL